MQEMPTFRGNRRVKTQVQIIFSEHVVSEQLCFNRYLSSCLFFSYKIAQRSCKVSLLGGLQKLPGCGPRQTALDIPA